MTDAEWRLAWLQRVERLRIEAKKIKKAFHEDYPVDYRCKSDMEGALNDIVGNCDKFIAGVLDGTFTEHRGG